MILWYGNNSIDRGKVKLYLLAHLENKLHFLNRGPLKVGRSSYMMTIHDHSKFLCARAWTICIKSRNLSYIHVTTANAKINIMS